MPTIEEIQTLVARQLGLAQVGPDDLLLEELGAESADIANLVAVVEDKYPVQIKESELAEIRTPRHLFALVQERLA